ncbi:MAG: hypothetical protein JSR57_07695 [Verrucomicrobia bacterium]|nr:hypothetical protein [Verrucomicrobiota bacterium]
MQKRENFMLNLQDFRRHLHYDRAPEALEALKQALSSYEKPEIYEEIDIELIHFIIHLDDTITFEKRSKISAKVKKILSDFIDKTPEIIPLWLLDVIDLTLADFPKSDDPRDILPLRKLLHKHPLNMELRLALAMALVQDSIEKNNELGFKESLSLFIELAPLFLKREERANRYRVYFPVNPESLFIKLRIWALFQYSTFLQKHDRDEEAIELLNAQASAPWIRLAEENDKAQIQTEIKILERAHCIADRIGSKYEKNLKHWIAILIGFPFFASMMGGILAGNHLTYPEIAKLVLVIALSTLLIVSASIFILGSNKKQKTVPLFVSGALLLTLFCFIVPDPVLNISSNFRSISRLWERSSDENANLASVSSTSLQNQTIPLDTSASNNEPNKSNN